MAEWLKATDCKSVLSRVRRFESFSAHKSSLLDENYNSGSSSFGRAIAFQAIGGEFEPRLPLNFSPACNGGCFASCCSSGVEHFLGKEEVVSSILINSSRKFFELLMSAARTVTALKARSTKTTGAKSISLG